MRMFTTSDLEKHLPLSWPKGWQCASMPSEDTNTICISLRRKKFISLGTASDGVRISLADKGNPTDVQKAISDAMKPSPTESILPGKTTREVLDDGEFKVYWIITPDLTDVNQERKKAKALLGFGRLLATLEGNSDEIAPEEACDLLTLIDFSANVLPTAEEQSLTASPNLEDLSAQLEQKIKAMEGKATELPKQDDMMEQLKRRIEQSMPQGSTGSSFGQSLVCSSCGETVVKGKFCANCGASLSPKVCGVCQAELQPSAKFCGECGEKI